MPRLFLSLRIKLNICSSRFRVHTHAASALINFCEGVERNTLLPYLDPIVEREPLPKFFNPAGDPVLVRRYLQEQAITTLAMVAEASEVTSSKVSKCPW
jgi:hypothetical protein